MIELTKTTSKDVIVTSSPKNKMKKLRKQESMTPEEALVALNHYNQKLKEANQVQEATESLSANIRRMDKELEILKFNGATGKLMLAGFGGVVASMILGGTVDSLFFTGMISIALAPAIDLAPPLRGVKHRVIGKAKIAKMEKKLTAKELS